MGGPSGRGACGEAAALARHIHDFVWDWVPSHLSPSPNTAQSYKTALTLYVLWLEEAGVTADGLRASDFGAKRIEEWLVWLAEKRGNSPQTCNARLSAMRSFARCVSTHDRTFQGLAFEAAAVPQRKAPKARVTGLKEEAVSAILSAPDQATRYGRRDAALMVTLYATACRIGELLAMRVSHPRLDGRHPHASVVGKGGKARVVFLPDGAVDHMRAYLREFHGDRPDPEAFVFYSRNHPPGQRRLSQDAVSKMLRKHAANAHGRCADVPLDVTAHRFRHARATHWLEGGMNVAQISMLLGHSTIQTTMAYLDVTLAAEEQAMQALVRSPQEKRWKGADTRLTVACGLEGP